MRDALYSHISLHIPIVIDCRGDYSKSPSPAHQTSLMLCSGVCGACLERWVDGCFRNGRLADAAFQPSLPLSLKPPERLGISDRMLQRTRA